MGLLTTMEICQTLVVVGEMVCCSQVTKVGSGVGFSKCHLEFLVGKMEELLEGFHGLRDGTYSC